MPVIVVTSTTPGAGKTGVAAAIARRMAYQGTPVRLVRIGDNEGGNAAADAEWFGSLDFAPGSAPTPAAPGSVTEPRGDITLIVEAAGESCQLPGARHVVVARHGNPGEMPTGIAPAAIVVTDVPAGHPEPTPGEGIPTVNLREDRTLAGFSLSEARSALNAEVLVQGDPGDPTSDYLVISPISSDAGQPYLRRFESKAVVARFDRTDMHLAAIKAQPNVLILTGGRKPSDYLYDVASAQGIPVLLSRTDTENTVIALEGIFDRTRFQGERKLDRMAELLEGSVLYEALGI
ncbi:MAG: DRTGG domain-containing protein [Dehalococcoidia bacterium]